MDLLHTEFKRKFSCSLYKKLRLPLAEMEFSKDFITDTRGDLYPILSKSDDCLEYVESNRYGVRSGSVCRLIGQFFPFATYEMTATVKEGEAGFRFILPSAAAEITVSNEKLHCLCGERKEELSLPENAGTMIVSYRPGRLTFISRKTARRSFS